jgi:hypothetical protein
MTLRRVNANAVFCDTGTANTPMMVSFYVARLPKGANNGSDPHERLAIAAPACCQEIGKAKERREVT